MKSAGQHRRGRSMGSVYAPGVVPATGVPAGAAGTHRGREKDEDLALFHEMRRREKHNFLHPSPDDLDATLSSKFGGIGAPMKKSGSDLLTSESDKNDYDWLLTPPGTPLFPSLDQEAAALAVLSPALSNGSYGSASSTSKSHKSAYSPSESVSKGNRGNPSPRRQHSTGSTTPNGISRSRSSPSPAATLARPSTPTFSSAGGGGSSRPSTPTGKSSASAFNTSNTPSVRASAPNLKVTISQSKSYSTATTPTGTRPSTPRSSTPPVRPSTPVGGRSSTPTSKPSTPTMRRSLSGGRTSLTSPSTTTTRGGPSPKRTTPSRGNSPSARRVTSVITSVAGMPTEAPPNLRTSVTERPSSSHGKPTVSNGGSRTISDSALLNVDDTAQSRRRPRSPSVARSYSSSSSLDQRTSSQNSRGSIVSSYDDGIEVNKPATVGTHHRHSSSSSAIGRWHAGGGQEELLMGGKVNAYAKRVKPKDLAGFGPVARKSPTDSEKRSVVDAYQSSPTTAYKNLHHANSPVSPFYSTRSNISLGSLLPRTTSAMNSSVTTSSNASSEHGTTVAADTEGSERDEDDTLSWDSYGRRASTSPRLFMQPADILVLDKDDEKSPRLGVGGGLWQDSLLYDRAGIEPPSSSHSQGSQSTLDAEVSGFYETEGIANSLEMLEQLGLMGESFHKLKKSSTFGGRGSERQQAGIADKARASSIEDPKFSSSLRAAADELLNHSKKSPLKSPHKSPLKSSPHKSPHRSLHESQGTPPRRHSSSPQQQRLEESQERADRSVRRSRDFETELQLRRNGEKSTLGPLGPNSEIRAACLFVRDFKVGLSPPRGQLQQEVGSKVSTSPGPMKSEIDEVEMKLRNDLSNDWDNSSIDLMNQLEVAGGAKESKLSDSPIMAPRQSDADFFEEPKSPLRLEDPLIPLPEKAAFQNEVSAGLGSPPSMLETVEDVSGRLGLLKGDSLDLEDRSNAITDDSQKASSLAFEKVDKAKDLDMAIPMTGVDHQPSANGGMTADARREAPRPGIPETLDMMDSAPFIDSVPEVQSGQSDDGVYAMDEDVPEMADETRGLSDSADITSFREDVNVVKAYPVDGMEQEEHVDKNHETTSHADFSLSEPKVSVSEELRLQETDHLHRGTLEKSQNGGERAEESLGPSDDAARDRDQEDGTVGMSKPVDFETVRDVVDGDVTAPQISERMVPGVTEQSRGAEDVTSPVLFERDEERTIAIDEKLSVVDDQGDEGHDIHAANSTGVRDLASESELTDSLESRELKPVLYDGREVGIGLAEQAYEVDKEIPEVVKENVEQGTEHESHRLLLDNEPILTSIDELVHPGVEIAENEGEITVDESHIPATSVGETDSPVAPVAGASETVKDYQTPYAVGEEELHSRFEAEEEPAEEFSFPVPVVDDRDGPSQSGFQIQREPEESQSKSQSQSQSQSKSQSLEYFDADSGTGAGPDDADEDEEVSSGPTAHRALEEEALTQKEIAPAENPVDVLHDPHHEENGPLSSYPPGFSANEPREVDNVAEKKILSESVTQVPNGTLEAGLESTPQAVSKYFDKHTDDGNEVQALKPEFRSASTLCAALEEQIAGLIQKIDHAIEESSKPFVGSPQDSVIVKDRRNSMSPEQDDDDHVNGSGIDGSGPNTEDLFDRLWAEEEDDGGESQASSIPGQDHASLTLGRELNGVRSFRASDRGLPIPDMFDAAAVVRTSRSDLGVHEKHRHPLDEPVAAPVRRNTEVSSPLVQLQHLQNQEESDLTGGPHLKSSTDERSDNGAHEVGPSAEPEERDSSDSASVSSSGDEGEDAMTDRELRSLCGIQGEGNTNHSTLLEDRTISVSEGAPPVAEVRKEPDGVWMKVDDTSSEANRSSSATLLEDATPRDVNVDTSNDPIEHGVSAGALLETKEAVKDDEKEPNLPEASISTERGDRDEAGEVVSTTTNGPTSEELVHEESTKLHSGEEPSQVLDSVLFRTLEDVGVRKMGDENSEKDLPESSSERAAVGPEEINVGSSEPAAALEHGQEITEKQEAALVLTVDDTETEEKSDALSFSPPEDSTRDLDPHVVQELENIPAKRHEVPLEDDVRKNVEVPKAEEPHAELMSSRSQDDSAADQTQLYRSSLDLHNEEIIRADADAVHQLEETTIGNYNLIPQQLHDEQATLLDGKHHIMRLQGEVPSDSIPENVPAGPKHDEAEVGSAALSSSRPTDESKSASEWSMPESGQGASSEEQHASVIVGNRSFRDESSVSADLQVPQTGAESLSPRGDSIREAGQPGMLPSNEISLNDGSSETAEPVDKLDIGDSEPANEDAGVSSTDRVRDGSEEDGVAERRPSEQQEASRVSVWSELPVVDFHSAKGPTASDRVEEKAFAELDDRLGGASTANGDPITDAVENGVDDQDRQEAQAREVQSSRESDTSKVGFDKRKSVRTILLSSAAHIPSPAEPSSPDRAVNVEEDAMLQTPRKADNAFSNITVISSDNVHWDHTTSADGTSTKEKKSPASLARSMTLAEATDTILYCSSLMHTIVYNAAAIAIDKEEREATASPPAAEPAPTGSDGNDTMDLPTSTSSKVSELPAVDTESSPQSGGRESENLSPSSPQGTVATVPVEEQQKQPQQQPSAPAARRALSYDEEQTQPTAVPTVKMVSFSPSEKAADGPVEKLDGQAREGDGAKTPRTPPEQQVIDITARPAPALKASPALAVEGTAMQDYKKGGEMQPIKPTRASKCGCSIM